MINEENIRWLKDTFQLDLFSQFLFACDRQVTFLININERPLTCRVMSGDPQSIYLPHQSMFLVDDLFDHVETNNLLAEVEGKNSFIDDMKLRFREFDKELFLYIPVKRDHQPLWLYVSFQRHHFHHHHFVMGRVIRVYESTPIEIIHYQKTYQDSLTRLFTRETLKMHMDNLANPVNSYIMFLDIDGFKRINDRYGHQAGDQFLVDISNHFIGKWEYNVLYYRLGGDEFFVYCYDHTREQIEERAQQLIHDIENLNDIAKTLSISVSIGIVPITEVTRGYHQLLNLGDDAMYESKKHGKGRYTFYPDEK